MILLAAAAVPDRLILWRHAYKLVLESWDGSCRSRGCDRLVGSSMDAVLVSQSLRRTRSSVALVESFLLPQRQLPSFVWSDSLQPCTCAFADTAEKHVLRVTPEISTVTDTVTPRLCWTGLHFWATAVKKYVLWSAVLHVACPQKHSVDLR